MTTINSPSAPQKPRLLIGWRRHHLHEFEVQRAVADRPVVLRTPLLAPPAGNRPAEIDCTRPQPIPVGSNAAPAQLRRGRGLCRQG